MGRPYSLDLRERVVRAVVKDGLLRHQAAAQIGVEEVRDMRNSRVVDIVWPLAIDLWRLRAKPEKR